MPNLMLVMWGLPILKFNQNPIAFNIDDNDARQLSVSFSLSLSLTVPPHFFFSYLHATTQHDVHILFLLPFPFPLLILVPDLVCARFSDDFCFISPNKIQERKTHCPFHIRLLVHLFVYLLLCIKYVPLINHHHSFTST